MLVLSWSIEHASKPIDIVFDNTVATMFARSVAASGSSKKLQAVVAVLWQILSMDRDVNWWHTYSHAGETWNEIVDDIVLKVMYKCGFALRELGTTIEMGSERFCFCDCLGVRGLGNSARGT